MATIIETDERDWSNGLPSELLHLISKKLPDISDFTRFRVVCKTWRLCAPASDPRPQLPWLLEFQKKSGNLRLYSTSSPDCLYTVHNTSFTTIDQLKGTSHGYLLTYGFLGDGFSLFNPLTHHRVRFPSINLKCPFPSCMGSSSNPLQSEYAVACGWLSPLNNILFDQTYMMAFCRPCDDKWIYNEWPLDIDAFYKHRGVIYKGKYLIMKSNTKVMAIDIETSTLAYVVPPFEKKKLCVYYLVESGGEIYRIDKYKDGSTKDYIFGIYKLDVGVEPMWIKIDGIDDQMLFLDVSHGIFVTATEFTGVGCRKNNIYYLDNKYRDELDRVDTTHLYRYNIEDQTTEKLTCPINASTWFIPTI